MADFSLGLAEVGTQVNLEGLEKGFDQAETTTKKRADGIGGFFGQAFAFATGGLIQKGIETLTGTVSDFFSGMIGDAREANQVMAQTEAVIKSTGGAAGFSAQQIADMASSLSAASGRSLFDDADIEKGQNLLLTFTNIKSTLPDATKTLVDMAAAMGTDVKSSAIQLGKALNAPIAGISVLSRLGVTFDEQQKRVITRLAKTGDVAGAQRIILAELNKEFGGSAQAAADADGGMAQFNARMGEAKEAIGTAVLPLLNELAGLLNNTVAPIIENAAARFGDLVAAFQTGAEGGDFIGGLTNALYSLDSVSPVFDTIADGINLVAGLADDAFSDGGGIGVLLDDIREMTGIDLSPLVGQVEGLIGAFTDAGPLSLEFAEAVGQISPVLGGVLQIAAEVLPSLEALVSQVLGDIVSYFQANGAQMLGEALTTWTSISDTISAIAGAIGPVISAVLDQISVFWQAHGEEILAFVGSTWTEINSIIQVAMQLIQATVVPALQFLAQFVTDHGAEIQAAFSGAWQIISNVIDAALTLIKGILTAALQAINGDWSGAWQTIQDMSARFVTDILGVISGGLQLIKASFDTAIDLILGIWNGLIGKSAGIGNDIINGIINGIKNAGDKLFDTLRNLAQSALQAAKDAIHIGSPSRDFADEVGGPIVEGIAQGVIDNANALYNTLGDVTAGGVDIMHDAGAMFGAALRESSAPDDAQDLGTDIMAGLIQGVEDHLSQAVQTMQDAAGEMLASAQDALGIASPSQMFADIGEMSMLGLLNGLEGMLPDLLEGIQDISTQLIESMSSMTDDAKKEAQDLVDSLAGIMEQLPDKVHSALADAFDATANIDRQKAKNIQALQDIGAAMIDIGGGAQELFDPKRFQEIIQRQLAEAEQAAAALNDPTQAAKFYKMRSQQIFELAKLQQQMASAQTDAERNRIRQQIADIQRAQQAEQAAFGQRSQVSNSNSLGALAEQLQTVLNAVPDAGQNPIWMQLYDLLVQINSARQPPTQGGGGQAAGFLAGGAGSALLAANSKQQATTVNISIDARGATNVAATEEAGYRGAKRALEEAGVKADVYKRTRR